MGMSCYAHGIPTSRYDSRCFLLPITTYVVYSLVTWETTCLPYIYPDDSFLKIWRNKKLPAGMISCQCRAEIPWQAVLFLYPLNNQGDCLMTAIRNGRIAIVEQSSHLDDWLNDTKLNPIPALFNDCNSDLNCSHALTITYIIYKWLMGKYMIERIKNFIL